MKIHIETIPHSSQRYPTVGDWFYDTDGTLHIKVSQMSDERYAILVAIHELIETVLCKHRHISQESVDKFDMAFEAEREALIKTGGTAKQHAEIVGAEPGDDPAAPYNKEHCFATGIERLMAAELDVKWVTYDNEIQNL
jgi:hypothetical protein